MNLHLGESALLIFGGALTLAVVALAVWFVIESIQEERQRGRTWTGKR